jgi:glutamate-1-semialdehyde aminotransferase
MPIFVSSECLNGNHSECRDVACGCASCGYGHNRPEVQERIKANRARKAMKISAHLKKSGITAEMLDRCTADDWLAMAKGAGANPPSEETRAMIRELVANG